MKRTLSIAMLTASLAFAPGCKEDKPAEGDKKADSGGKSGDDGGAKADGGGDGGAKAGGDGGGSKDGAGLGGKVGSGSSAAALALVPDGAMMVGQLDLSGLSKIPGFDMGLAMAMAQDPEVAKVFGALQACNLEIKNLKDITFGMNDPDKAEQVVVIINGGGVGKLDNLKCANDKRIAEGGGKDDIKFEKQDGKDVVVFDGGDGFAHLTSDDQLIIASKDWNDAVKGLVGGNGKSAKEGSLAGPLAYAKTTKQMWMAMTVPDSLAGELKGMPDVAGAKGAAAYFDVSTGLELHVDVDMGDAAAAEKGSKFMSTQFEQVKPMAGMLGIPQPIVDKVKFGSDGKLATVNLTLSEEDAKALMEMANAGGKK